jgi:hypothetical protein
MVHLGLGWRLTIGTRLFWVLVGVVGLLGILALRWVSAGGHAAGGIVCGGRDLGFRCSGGETGSELGSRQHERVLDASGIGHECVDNKGDPVRLKEEPVQP